VLLINATDCWSTAKVKFKRIAKEYFPTASYGWIFLYVWSVVEGATPRLNIRELKETTVFASGQALLCRRPEQLTLQPWWQVSTSEMMKRGCSFSPTHRKLDLPGRS
jgi:hypothetical protein